MVRDLDHLRRALSGRYRIEHELGRGGMATVYLADDVKHHRQVALKVLRPELSIALGPERFLREIEISARLHHPHILALYDSGEVDHFLYYVMPYVEGESLRDRLDRETRLPVEEAVRLTREIADALTYAHSRNVIHRDIKPENVLLSSGHALVADFGIARAISAAGGEQLTQTGLAVGTPAYMSPEQAVGQENLDPRTDVYSLGCVLFEMLVGEIPHAGPNAQAIIAGKLSAPVPAVSTVRSGVPESIERATEKALDREPADRFSTPAEFAAALAIPSLPTGAVPTVPRRRTRVAGVVTLTVAAAVVAALWLIPGILGGNGRIEALAVLPFDNLTGDENQMYLVDGMHESLIASLASLQSVRVISRVSVMQYRNSDAPLPEIASDLDVDAVVSGSVLQAAGDVRVTVHLIRADPETELWAETYERDLADVFAMHRDVAGAIAREIEASADVSSDRARPERLDPAAQDAYFRGRHFWRRQAYADVTRAIEYFEQALAIDSLHARAHAGLADSYILLSWAGPDPLPPTEAYPRAKAAAVNALEIDEHVAEAHVSLALVLWRHDWDFDAAERHFRRAILLSPNESMARQWYGLFLTSMGRHDEAAREFQVALARDPFARLIVANSAWAAYFARRPDDAIRSAKSAAEMWTEFAATHYVLGLAYEQRDRITDAVAEFRSAVAVAGPLPYLLGALGHAFARQGARDSAEAILRELGARSYAPPSLSAGVHVALGNTERALQLLEQAYAVRDAYLVFLGVAPTWDPLRDDPAFANLLTRVGF